MGLHHFDKQVKDKLQFHHTEVDPILWDKIEAHLPGPDKNRFPPGLWIASVIILFSALTFGIYSFQKTYSTSDQKIVLTSNGLESKSPVVFEGNVVYPFTSGFTNVPDTENLKTKSVNIVSVEEKKSILAKEKKSGFSSKTQKVTSDLTNSEKSLFFDQSKVYSGSEKMEDIDLLFTHVKPISGFVAKSIRSLSGKKIENKDYCLEDFSTTGRGMTLEAFYGNDFPIRSMKARNETFANLVNERKKTETPLYSYSLGARLGFNITDQLRISTGVYYSQLNEKFEYVDPESSQTKVVKTTLYIKDGQGNIKDSTFTFDTIYIPGTLIYKIQNQYTTIDLPFLVGFHAYEGSKIDIHLNVGILANLVFQKSGMALVNENSVVRNFTDTNENTFNNSLGISSYVGAQFSYKWKSNVNFFIEPNVRIQHRGLTSRDYPIAHKYTIVSFFTGASYNF